MPIIIFKYPNKGIHTGRMRNVSGRKMKLLPAAVRAGPVPGLGDICSKLFTPWQTALHIYYGAVVQLPPRIMEVLLPSLSHANRQKAWHETRVENEIENNSKNNRLANDLRWFRWLLNEMFFVAVVLLVSLFVCCVCPM